MDCVFFSVVFNFGTRNVCESSGTLLQNNQNIPSLSLMLEIPHMCQLFGGKVTQSHWYTSITTNGLPSLELFFTNESWYDEVKKIK